MRASGSLRRHVVNAVPVLIVVLVHREVHHLTVERLLHEICRHIVAIPIEQIVAIVLMVLQTLYDVVTCHLFRRATVSFPQSPGLVIFLISDRGENIGCNAGASARTKCSSRHSHSLDLLDDFGAISPARIVCLTSCRL